MIKIIFSLSLFLFLSLFFYLSLCFLFSLTIFLPHTFDLFTILISIFFLSVYIFFLIYVLFPDMSRLYIFNIYFLIYFCCNLKPSRVWKYFCEILSVCAWHKQTGRSAWKWTKRNYHLLRQKKYFKSIDVCFKMWFNIKIKSIIIKKVVRKMTLMK